MQMLQAGMLAKPRVLIVEDEDAQAEMLRYNFDREGFDVSVAADGDEAMLAVEEHQPDLVLLDLMLPGTSGIAVCQRLRSRPETRALPIIMLTARGEEGDRVRGFESGADDYVVKPFSPSELVARVRAILRRARPSLGEERLVRGDIVMDLATHRVTRGGKRIHLGPTEFRLLRLFMERPCPGVHARAAARPGLGAGHPRRTAHRRRAHPPASQGARRARRR